MISLCFLLASLAPVQEHDSLDIPYERCVHVLQEHPCDSEALRELRRIGIAWHNETEKQQEVLFAFETLHACNPDDADILYYYGVHLARAGRLSEAERVLERCVQRVPNHGDADVQLGYVYLWQNRLDEAESTFLRYPKNSDAQMGLAQVYRRKKQNIKALTQYRSILQEHPEQREARSAYARLLAEERSFSEAHTQYAWLVDNDPNTQANWTEWFGVRPFVHPSVQIETYYTDAKENDPSLRAPVVKDYYFFNNVYLFIPIFDSWRLALKQIYYHQRENDIYPPVGVNYSMYLAGGQLTSSWYFSKEWKWDLYARLFEAWGHQHVNYPFHRTTKGEAGANVMYNTDHHFFVVDLHRESFVIKNFSLMRSQLLNTDFASAVYRYRFLKGLDPELEADLSHIWIQGDNWENTEALLAKCKIPFLKYCSVRYRFDHGHFDKLNQNYYSFLQQYMNTLGVVFRYEFESASYIELSYDHRWKKTYNLLQPIGSFVYVAESQYLVANKVLARVGYRYKSSLQLELGGHYFYETLPYRDWNINGSFLWQF